MVLPGPETNSSVSGATTAPPGDTGHDCHRKEPKARPRQDFYLPNMKLLPRTRSQLPVYSQFVSSFRGLRIDFAAKHVAHSLLNQGQCGHRLNVRHHLGKMPSPKSAEVLNIGNFEI